MSLNTLFKVPNPRKQFPRIDLTSIIFLPDKPQLFIICDDTVCLYSFSTQASMVLNTKSQSALRAQQQAAASDHNNKEEVVQHKYDTLELKSGDIKHLEDRIVQQFPD